MIPLPDWHARGLDWALADSLAHPTKDEWVADDIARAFAAGAAAAQRQALEEVAQEFDRRNNGIGFYEPQEPAQIVRSLIDKDTA